MMMKKYLLVSFFVYMACVSSVASASDPAHDGQLDRLVSTLKDSARVLDKREIHAVCGSAELTNYIRADFDGNGAEDYAALVIASSKKEPIRWEERTLIELELWVVVFLNTKDGYRHEVLEILPTFIPDNDIGLRASTPGSVIKSQNVDSSLQLKFTGIDRVYCEKSETIFYWDGTRFRTLSVAD